MKKTILAMLILASCTKEKTEPTQSLKLIETKQFIFNTYSRNANNTIVNDTEINSSMNNDYQFARTMAKGDSIRIEVVSNIPSDQVKLNIVRDGLVIFNLQGKTRIKHTFKYE